ncbi:N-acetyltransferase family protein [Aliivibrio kagoshimensis]|uniref:GNAT family N-acetyltransferase n=1 Tax=Aliivibrio kagoshimensis TaxID=2910230 RepID=UPI003D0A96CE
MGIIIERATNQDIDQVSELFNQYRLFYGCDDQLNLAKQFIAERISLQQSVVFFAKDEKGVMLGFTQLYPSFSSVSMQSIWVLNDLFVAESARGLGVGRVLMERAKEHAAETKAKGLALETAVTNDKAQGLYESLGYEKQSDYFSYFLSL